MTDISKKFDKGELYLIILISFLLGLTSGTAISIYWATKTIPYNTLIIIIVSTIILLVLLIYVVHKILVFIKQ